jgi:hypothetical protein
MAVKNGKVMAIMGISIADMEKAYLDLPKMATELSVISEKTPIPKPWPNTLG